MRVSGTHVEQGLMVYQPLRMRGRAGCVSALRTWAGRDGVSPIRMRVSDTHVRVSDVHVGQGGMRVSATHVGQVGWRVTNVHAGVSGTHVGQGFSPADSDR
jgi:hypothetical protein